MMNFVTLFINLWCHVLLPLLVALPCRNQRPVRRFSVIGMASLLALFLLLHANAASAFPLRIYYIPSGSMENTFKLGDRLIVNSEAYRQRAPKNGELVVFKAPIEALLNASNPEADITFFKRVVGTSRQKVEIVRGQLFVDGKKINEPYIKPPGKSQFEPAYVQYGYDMKIFEGTVYSRDYITPDEPGPWVTNGLMAPAADQEVITRAKTGAVPVGRMLVLGDNRSNSNDSHVFGFVRVSSLRGRVMVRIWPLSRIRWFGDSTAK